MASSFLFLLSTLMLIVGEGRTLDRSDIQTAVKYMAAIYGNVQDTTDKKWFHTGKDSYGYVARDSKNIVVAIRGTRTVVNMVHNFKILRDPYPGCTGCEVHRGYMQTYKTSQKFIIDTVKKFIKKYPGSKIYVTGYSLGAVQATYCAVDLSKLGYKVNLISFGSPRPGNKAFAEYANRVIGQVNYHVTHGYDPCTIIPPKSIGYYHVGTEVHYTDSKTYQIVLPVHSDQTWIRMNLLDHYIGYYRSLQ